MTVAHKDLTGTDLHEIKGASSATSGQVPVANGSGSAPFGLLTASSLTGTGNPFGANLFHVREEQSSTVSSQSPITASSWQTNALNTTVTNEISGASLASNQLTLPAGTYFIDASISYRQSGSSNVYYQPRLYNSTTASTLVLGHTQVAGIGGGGSTNDVQGVAVLKGRFTLAGTSTILLQSYKTSALVPTGFGIGQEVYTDVLIWKVL